MARLSLVRPLAIAVALGLGLVITTNAYADEPAPAPAPTPPPQPKVQWHRDAKDPRWVQGEVTVDALPDAVFARVERVDAWPQFLSDVLRLKVLEHKPGSTHWKIELETRTLGHGMLGYDVDVGPGRTLKLYTNRLGVKAVAQTLVRPVGTTQTNVVYSFFIELSGLPSLLISDKDMREKQEHMVAVTLADVAKAFPTKAAPAPPPPPQPP